MRTTLPFSDTHDLADAVPIQTKMRIRPWLAAAVMLAGLVAGVLIAAWFG